VSSLRAAPSHRRSRTDLTGGAAGNERLTAMTGAILLVLLAAEGVTILFRRQLLTAHFFIGMMLVGPVLLKMGSTSYRFVRYYTGPSLTSGLARPRCRSGCSVRLSSQPRWPSSPRASRWPWSALARARPSGSSRTRPPSWHGSARCLAMCSGTHRNCRACLAPDHAAGTASRQPWPARANGGCC
jgi:hypothetical protein